MANKKEIDKILNADINGFSTPFYIIDERLIEKNLKILKSVSDKTGAKILLAQKAFSTTAVYPLISKYLSGTAASGLFEARLGFEEMGKEVHTYSPAFNDEEFDEILKYSDTIIFNSLSQYKKFRQRVISFPKEIQIGLRINPEYSEQEHDNGGIYDPCSPFSRLGATIDTLNLKDFDGIDGIHFHTLCEQNSTPLMNTLEVIIEKFDPYLQKVKWVNFGGGHHITRKDYDIPTLIKAIEMVKNRYNCEVILEPGEAVVLNTGYLVTSVLDIMQNGMQIAILDTSASCHMPDVLEMPYRPHIIGSGLPSEKAFTYRFGGPTCLAGDVIGDYSFDSELKVGEKLIFTDMAHYSMVKNNTFNGIGLPSISVIRENGNSEIVAEFGYENFKIRLG